jgi:hypothetical protein
MGFRLIALLLPAPEFEWFGVPAFTLLCFR